MLNVAFTSSPTSCAEIILTVCLCVAAWVLVNMFLFFYILKLLGYFRVNAADEAAGLDASHHGGSAYPVDLDDDASHKGSSYNGNQSGYNKVCTTPLTSSGVIQA